MEAILPGEVAWYVTGRFYERHDGTSRDAGYFLHLQGVDGKLLFTGDPGEGTARLTFLAAPFTATPLQNGDLSLGMDVVGDFGVYLNRDGGGRFDDPESFGAGQEVARFRRASVVMGTTVGTGTANTPLFGLNVFSARLVDSRPFDLDGRRCDFRELLPNGITQWGTTSATPAAELHGYKSVIPFVGSAIAIGGGRPPGGAPPPPRPR